MFDQIPDDFVVLVEVEAISETNNKSAIGLSVTSL
jgi:hypothetical protein